MVQEEKVFYIYTDGSQHSVRLCTFERKLRLHISEGASFDFQSKEKKGQRLFDFPQ